MATLKLGSTTAISESSGAITYDAGTLGSGVILATPTFRVYNVGSHTWTKPANLSYIRLRVQGSGGGGARGNNSDTPGGGGGAGGYSETIISASALGSNETVTVGAGGGGKLSSLGVGTAGNTSSFGSHCSATGGTVQGAWHHGGGGGIGTTSGSNCINCKGGGGDGADLSIPKNMQGGSSVLGGGPGRENQGSALAGGAYGAGGNGAMDNGNSGYDGVVIVEEY